MKHVSGGFIPDTRNHFSVKPSFTSQASKLTISWMADISLMLNLVVYSTISFICSVTHRKIISSFIHKTMLIGISFLVLKRIGSWILWGSKTNWWLEALIWVCRPSQLHSWGNCPDQKWAETLYIFLTILWGMWTASWGSIHCSSPQLLCFKTASIRKQEQFTTRTVFSMLLVSFFRKKTK